MSEVDDVAGRLHPGEEVACRPSGGPRPGGEDGRIEVPLHRPAPPVPALKGGEVHPPVHREHLRRKLRVRVHEVGRILQEEDPLHPGRSDRLQQGREMGADESFPIGAGE